MKLFKKTIPTSLNDNNYLQSMSGHKVKKGGFRGVFKEIFLVLYL